jgi:GNAT superfamily N-acetyltransferase
VDIAEIDPQDRAPWSDREIIPLDAADQGQMTAWHATYLAAEVHGREHSVPWMLEEMRAEFLGDRPGERMLGFARYVAGVPVSTGTLTLPLMDNLHLAFVAVHTHPEHRRRGHGTHMLEELIRLAREQGRRTVAAEAATTYDGNADGSGHPNADFLLHRGFTCAIGDVMRVLDLPTNDAMLQRLVDDAAAHHADYEMRQFLGPVPDDILDAFGTLIGSLVTEAPMGELELEAEVMTAERIRADERVFAASGRTKYTTVALARDGEPAAYSELVVPAHDPGHVHQWGTLVHPLHRGHRLGQATKALNLLWLQRERPGPALLVTYNAEVNAHMIAVNHAMGFRPVERLGEYQLHLA